MPIEYHEQPTSHLLQQHPSKPSKGTRFLVLLIQVAVMAFALFLFFLFAGIAALVLFHLLVAGRALRRRARTNPTYSRKGYSGNGLLHAELKTLPCTRYATNGRPSVDCAVCLDTLRDGERIRALPSCRHVFHKGCVDKWLVRSAACPICRAVVGGR